MIIIHCDRYRQIGRRWGHFEDVEVVNVAFYKTWIRRKWLLRWLRQFCDISRSFIENCENEYKWVQNGGFDWSISILLPVDIGSQRTVFNDVQNGLIYLAASVVSDSDDYEAGYDVFFHTRSPIIRKAFHHDDRDAWTILVVLFWFPPLTAYLKGLLKFFHIVHF